MVVEARNIAAALQMPTSSLMPTRYNKMDQLIDGQFSIQFVLEKMFESTQNPNYHVNNITGFDYINITNGAAFMSNIYRVHLHWINNKIEPKSIVLKIPELIRFENEEPRDDESSLEYLEYAHSKEIDFYKQFSTYKEPLKLPKFYYGRLYCRRNKEGVIIMEDLSNHATTIPMIPGFSHEQILSIVEELARFHCVSWRNPDWTKAFKVPLDEFPESVIEFFSSVGEQLKTIRPEMFTDTLDEMKKHYTMENARNNQYSGEKFASLVHSDMWAPNVLFEKDENGNATNKVNSIIDWQTFVSGNPCADLARLLSLNTTSEYRRSKTEKIMHFYIDKVTEFMDGKPMFNFEQIKKAYDLCLPMVALYTAFGAPMYYAMPSVVGKPTDSDRAAKQEELLDRIHKFLLDTLTALKSYE